MSRYAQYLFRTPLLETTYINILNMKINYENLLEWKNYIIRNPYLHCLTNFNSVLMEAVSDSIIYQYKIGSLNKYKELAIPNEDPDEIENIYSMIQDDIDELKASGKCEEEIQHWLKQTQRFRPERLSIYLAKNEPRAVEFAEVESKVDVDKPDNLSLNIADENGKYSKKRIILVFSAHGYTRMLFRSIPVDAIRYLLEIIVPYLERDTSLSDVIDTIEFIPIGLTLVFKPTKLPVGLRVDLITAYYSNENVYIPKEIEENGKSHHIIIGYDERRKQEEERQYNLYHRNY